MAVYGGMSATLTFPATRPPRSESACTAAPANAAVEANGIDASVDLVKRACAGDRDAENEICRQYLPRLRGWARGRLPAGARPLYETADIVQDVLSRAVRAFPSFTVEHEGSFPAFLRTILSNRLVDLGRSVRRRPPDCPLDPERTPASREPSPFERAVGTERHAQFERAMQRLSAVDRELIVLRMELGCDYAEMVTVLGRGNANALRVATRRAIVRLGAALTEDGVL